MILFGPGADADHPLGGTLDVEPEEVKALLEAGVIYECPLQASEDDFAAQRPLACGSLHSGTDPFYHFREGKQVADLDRVLA